MPSYHAPHDRLGMDQGVTRALTQDETRRLEAATAVAASPVKRLARPKATKKRPAGKPKPKPKSKR